MHKFHNNKLPVFLFRSILIELLQFIQFMQEATPLDSHTTFHNTKQRVYSAP